MSWGWGGTCKPRSLPPKRIWESSRNIDIDNSWKRSQCIPKTQTKTIGCYYKMSCSGVNEEKSKGTETIHRSLLFFLSYLIGQFGNTFSGLLVVILLVVIVV